MSQKRLYLIVNLVIISIASGKDTNKPCGDELNILNNDFIKSSKVIFHSLKGQGIHFYAATSDQVKRSPCRRKPPTEQEMNNYFNSFKEKSATNSVRGVTFEDESPELVEVFKRLTTQYYSIGGEKDDQINIQKEYSINPSCKKVVCSVKKIFGNELGPKLLYMNKKFGLNGSDISFPSSSRLRDNEIDRMIIAAQDFPQSTFPLSSNKRYTKFKRGNTLLFNKPTDIANSTISFFDKWNELESNEMMEYMAFHELGHFIAHELGLVDNSQWPSLGGWVNKDRTWTTSKKDKCISIYGQADPTEDFAESVAAYRYNPEFFKEISPEKYNYIKEVVFNGIEYISSDQCSPNNSYENILSEMAKKELTTFNYSAYLEDKSNIEKVMQKCKKESINFIFSNDYDSIDRFEKCLSSDIKQSITIKLVDQLDPPLKYPELVIKKITDYPREILPDHKINGEQNIQLAAKKMLIDKVVEGFYNWDQRHDYKYPASDAKSLCNFMKDNAYQSLENIDELLNGEMLAFSVRNKVQSLFYDTCIKIQKKIAKPMSKDKIAQEISISIKSKKNIDKK